MLRIIQIPTRFSTAVRIRRVNAFDIPASEAVIEHAAGFAEAVMSDVRLKIKVGLVEVEVDGSEAFVLGKFPALLSQVLDENGWANSRDLIAASTVATSLPGSPQGGSALEQSTNTIASIMDAKTGPDLAMAACAHLALVKGQPKFSRKEILDEMQSATAYYNQNYSGNLSKILQSLMKAKRVNLVANQTYSLPKSQIEFFQNILKEE